MNELTKIGPEGFDIANAYIQYGSVERVSEEMSVPAYEVVKILQMPEVKRYLDGVYLDLGYRNRNKLGALLDKMIESKVEEAEESGLYTSKDLFDLVTLQHKMRMDELKLEATIAKERGEGSQTHVQIANITAGGDNYSKLMERLLTGGKK